MRCLGLTNERRRCTESSVDSTGYCEQHRDVIILIDEQKVTGSNSQSGVFSIFKKLRGDSIRPVISDDAHFDIPVWIKRSKTEVVIDHLLHHSDAMARWSAAFALRKRREPIAIEPLWEALQRDESSMVRQQAAVALGKIGTLAVLGPLIEALWHDADSGVRQACAIALGNLNFDSAAKDLAAALTRERAAFVRWDCVVALGQVGDPSLEPLLVEFAEKERAQVIRDAYHDAHAKIRQRKLGGVKSDE